MLVPGHNLRLLDEALEPGASSIGDQKTRTVSASLNNPGGLSLRRMTFSASWLDGKASLKPCEATDLGVARKGKISKSG